MQRWEYCLAVPAPPGPVQVTVTFYSPAGAEKRVYRAEDYSDGSERLWPQVIAELGRDGWELVTVYQEGFYFKRPLGAE